MADMGKLSVKNSVFILFLAVFWVFFAYEKYETKVVTASSANGTIDNIYKYAWGEHTGLIDFGAENGNVRVDDLGLSGYAFSEKIGWIYLDNVKNDGYGNLSGYAFSEATGWIEFKPIGGGVIIDSSGEFTGKALGEDIGWIVFGGNYKLKTDWRPKSIGENAAKADATIILNGAGENGNKVFRLKTIFLTAAAILLFYGFYHILKFKLWKK